MRGINDLYFWRGNTMSISDQESQGVTKKLSKKWLLSIPVIVGTLAMVSVFQNCSKKGSVSGDSSASVQTVKEEDKLFLMLTEAIEVAETLKVKTNLISPRSNETTMVGNWDGSQISEELLAQEKLVYEMITQKGYATNSVDVLKEVDNLLNLLSSARDIRTYQWSVLDNLGLLTQVKGLIKSQSDEDKAFAKTLNDQTNQQLEQFKGEYQSWKSKVDETFRLIQVEKENTRKELESLDKIRAKVCKMDLDVLSTANKNTVEGFPIIDPRWHGAGLPLDLDTVPTPANKNGCVGPSTISCSAFKSDEAITQCKNVVAILDNHQQQLNALRNVAISHDAMLGGIVGTLYGEKDKNNGLVHVMDGVQTRLGSVEGRLGTVSDQLAGKAPSELLAMLNNVDNRTKDANGVAFDFRKWAADINEVKDIGQQVAELSAVQDLLNDPRRIAKKIIDITYGGIRDEKGPLIYDPIRNKLNELGVLDVGVNITSAEGHGNFEGWAQFTLTTSKNSKNQRPFFVVLSKTYQNYMKVLGSSIYMRHDRDWVGFHAGVNTNNGRGVGIWDFGDNNVDEQGNRTGGSGDAYLAVVIPTGVATKTYPAPVACGDAATSASNPDFPAYMVGRSEECTLTEAETSARKGFEQLTSSGLNAVVPTGLGGNYGGKFRCEQMGGVSGSRLVWVLHACTPPSNTVVDPESCVFCGYNPI